MLALNLNYDRKYDILYARASNYSPSYGEEDDGVVTLRSISTDEITGMIIYNAKKRRHDGDIASERLPIPLDLNATSVCSLLDNPRNGHKITLQLA